MARVWEDVCRSLHWLIAKTHYRGGAEGAEFRRRGFTTEARSAQRLGSYDKTNLCVLGVSAVNPLRNAMRG